MTDTRSLILVGAVIALALVAFAGFAALGRTGRWRLALVVAGLEAVWLGYIAVRYLTETYDIARVALSVMGLCQAMYLTLSALGWISGSASRRMRRTTGAPRRQG